ncbi:hypothetical protein GTR02_09870 [Kineococcus sp. R8]|nr:hypothetical protein [Kineococcus siccus]
MPAGSAQSPRSSSRWRSWWAPPVALGRIAVLRFVLYAFVVLDALHLTTWPLDHGDVPAQLYRPILLRRLLDLPAPTETSVRVVLVVLVASAVVAALGRLPRAAGWVCAAAYLEWTSNAFSYSKIDHDHVALLVALLVLPTVGPARDAAVRSEAAGWAVRCVQVATVCTYFLAALAKMRFGGWDWANGAIFTWAFSRRGSDLTDALLAVPHLVLVMQWGVLVAEFLSPVLLWLRGRALAAAVAFWVLFHVGTYLTIGIHFLPTVVCLLAFVPLERLPRAGRSGAGRSRA